MASSLIELYVGIICASLPILKPLGKRHFPGLLFRLLPEPRQAEHVYISPITGLSTLRGWTTVRSRVTTEGSVLRSQRSDLSSAYDQGGQAESAVEKGADQTNEKESWAAAASAELAARELHDEVTGAAAQQSPCLPP